MKKLTLTFCALFALFVVAPAIYADGPEPSGKKEVMQPAPPVCDFYRAHEWDLDIWGAYAFASDTGQFDVPNVDPFFPDTDPFTVDLATGFIGEQKIDNHGERVNLGLVSRNQLFGRDNTFGGGGDVKYFWSKYFGAGVEAVGLAAKTKFAGGSLFTLTARYPFGRFAPYVTGGVGFIDGGAALYKFYNEKNVFDTGSALFARGISPGPPASSDQANGLFVRNEHEFFTVDPVKDTHIRGIGQIGAGMEFRITCHVGLMADFTWNFVFGLEDHADKFHLITEQGENVTQISGFTVLRQITINQAVELIPGHGSDHQDFGMARFGVTFSY